MDFFDEETLEQFISEVTDLLDDWEAVCLELKKGVSIEIFNGLFRAAHNIKGTARALGLNEYGEFVHKVEDLIVYAKNDLSLINEDFIDILLDAQFLLASWLKDLSATKESLPNFSDFDSRIDKLISALSGNTENEKKTDSPSEQKIEETPEEEFTPLFGGDKESNEEEEKEEDPPPQALEEVSAAPEPSPSPAPAQTQKDSTKNKEVNKPKSESIRVKSEKLDGLIQAIGELSIHQSIIAHCLKSSQMDTQTCHNAIQFASKITKEIQNQSLSLRMQTIGNLFQRLERVAYDVARVQGKKIDVQIQGADQELDKAIIQIITEPLTHIVRNAVDHGMESPEDRIAAGKDETASLEIMARNDAEGVRIFITDNGGGINPDKILMKAMENNIVGDPTGMSKEEIINLIFKPGFSTAEKVTDFSGRGVGMEVVKKAIDDIGGNITIKSEYGKGTCFILYLPANLNMIDSVVVEVADEPYLVPLQDIVEIVDLKENKVKNNDDKHPTELALRDLLIPIENLLVYLNRPLNAINESGQTPNRPAIIVGSDSKYVAWEVGKILGQQRIIVKPILGKEKYPPQVSGATILSDGRPGLILSLGNLTKEVNSKRCKNSVAS